MAAASTTTHDSTTQMFAKIIASDKTIKSQQRGDPELTLVQKNDVLSDLLVKSPGSFLSRFGSVLNNEDLLYFADSDDYVVQHHLKELQKLLVGTNKQKRTSNRRYKAIEDLTATSNYFTEEQMRERCPLLYEQYIGMFLTEEEKEKIDRCKNKGELSLAAHISNKMDNDLLHERLHQELKSEKEMGGTVLGDNNVGVLTIGDNPEQDRHMLRKEFLRIMHLRFINGEDDYDYTSIDNNEEYDVTSISDRDCEDSYFDSEEPSTTNEPMSNGSIKDNEDDFTNKEMDY